MTLNGSLHFVADLAAPSCQVWTTDGTEGGAQPLYDSCVNGMPATAYGLTTVGNQIFTVAGGCHVAGCELWRTDGTSLGTELVEDINPGGFSDPEQLTDVNGTLLFTADDGSHGRELWSSDGTPAGTSLVADLEPTGSSELLELTGLGSTLLFTYDDGVHGRELWRYVP